MKKTVKQFLIDYPIIKRKHLAEKIDWNVYSMHQWLNGMRGIPENHEKNLRKELRSIRKKMNNYHF